jgi:fructosamine-3-kinase
MKVAGVALHQVSPVSGGDIAQAFRATTEDGAVVFAKRLPDAPPGLFAAEAAGLERLRVAGGPRLPAVVAVADDGLVLEWVEPTSPSEDVARRFGRELARMHRATAPQFGADSPGYLATLPLDNAPAADWPVFHRDRRLLPFLELARNRAVIDGSDEAVIEEVSRRLADLAGPPEPPALVHGDLWWGNLLWSAAEGGAVWLVDAGAAHYGHREIDLAMLALFDAPHLDVLVEAYDGEYPLAPGWRDRQPLHQVLPLLAHALLFGGGYGAQAAGAASRALRAVDG